LRAMCDSMAAREGPGLSCRNAAAVISIPDVQ
jgi:hypothetical protein